MSKGLARKACARCGQESFAHEWACWACGTPFAAPNNAPTLMPAPSRAHGQGIAAAVGLLVLLVGIGLGYWIARATTGRPASSPLETTALPSIPPGEPLIPAPSLSGGRSSSPVRLPPPPVGARPPGGDPWRRPAPAPTYSPAYPTPLPRSGYVLPPQRAVPRARVKSVTPTAAGPSHGARAQARKGAARVGLINTESVPLSVAFDGPELQPLTVAPGVRIPVDLKAGSYRLILMIGAEKRPLGPLTLENGKSYTVQFNRSRVLNVSTL